MCHNNKVMGDGKINRIINLLNRESERRKDKGKIQENMRKVKFWCAQFNRMNNGQETEQGHEIF